MFFSEIFYFDFNGEILAPVFERTREEMTIDER